MEFADDKVRHLRGSSSLFALEGVWILGFWLFLLGNASLAHFVLLFPVILAQLVWPFRPEWLVDTRVLLVFTRKCTPEPIDSALVC